jgi:DnaK suppressor protein
VATRARQPKTPAKKPPQRLAPLQKPQQKRHAELIELLQERRNALTLGVRTHLQRARDGDEHQQSEDTTGEGVSARDDISLALAQIQGELLQRIDAALARVAAGTYGDCSECGSPIPSQRLRALPFAVRCLDCEASREAGPASSRRRWSDEPGDVTPRSRRALDAI